MGEKGWAGHLDWGFVWGCIPVNAQGAQWDCRCIPVNAQGDQWDCTVSGNEPGDQLDFVGVCVCVWGIPIPPGKAIFRWTCASILLPENWVSWIFPNIWRDTVSKWTHRLLQEVYNRKEACILHVGAVIHDYQGEGVIWSRKCQARKDCTGDLTSLNVNNVTFCRRSRPYQREASRPSGPGWCFLGKKRSASHPPFLFYILYSLFYILYSEFYGMESGEYISPDFWLRESNPSREVRSQEADH